MVLSPAERQFVSAARVGRLATADDDGRPAVVPICFALLDSDIVSAVDEKPKTAAPSELRRIRDVEANPFVALVVDRYDEDWSRLGWVQIRGRASVVEPDNVGHTAAVAALREKYSQYRDHALDARPVLEIEPGGVVSWGAIGSR